MKEEKSLEASSIHRASARSENYLSKEMIRYIEHAVDPKRAPFAPMPSVPGLYTGEVEGVPMLAKFEVTVGTGGFGFVMVDPFTCAGCTDRMLATTTTSAYTGTGSSQILRVAGVGVEGVYPSRTSLTGAGFGSGNQGAFGTLQVNACGVYITPIGSATTQNGTINLLEVPNHPSNVAVGAALSVEQVLPHKRTRLIRGVQLGDPSFKNVLNYHPQPGQANQLGGPFRWMAPSSALTELQHQTLVVIVTGDPGTKYQVEIQGSWLLKGLDANPTHMVYSDVEGMQAYLNAVASKRQSGWVGAGGLATSLYKSFVAHHAKHIAPSVRREQNARADLNKAKAKNDLRSPSFLDHVKSLAPALLDIAGFALGKKLF